MSVLKRLFQDHVIVHLLNYTTIVTPFVRLADLARIVQTFCLDELEFENQLHVLYYAITFMDYLRGVRLTRRLVRLVQQCLVPDVKIWRDLVLKYYRQHFPLDPISDFGILSRSVMIVPFGSCSRHWCYYRYVKYIKLIKEGHCLCTEPLTEKFCVKYYLDKIKHYCDSFGMCPFQRDQVYRYLSSSQFRPLDLVDVRE